MKMEKKNVSLILDIIIWRSVELERLLEISSSLAKEWLRTWPQC